LAPVGPGGESVIDLLGSDALSAGFATIVLVIGPATGPAIRYHVERTWPSEVDVRFELQPQALGTVDAVLAGTQHISPDRAIGVANADDLYGEAALATLVGHLRSESPTEALVAFRLRDTVVGESPVTRGVCEVDAQGRLVSITERRQVRATGKDRFVADDGLSPGVLDGGTLVSMNLWAFTSAMREILTRAMTTARHASEDCEVLLPDVVAEQLVSSGTGTAPGEASKAAQTPGLVFTVLPATGRCIGVTHPDDLAIVQAQLAHAVGAGERRAQLWSSPRTLEPDLP
jgi:hypothetical protein